MKNPKLLLMMLLSVSVLGESAAACSTPTGAEGQLKYDTTAKQLAVCNGTSWVAVGGGGGGIDGGTPPGTWNAGSAVYRTATACNVNIGDACGGGIFAGDYNLVVSKANAIKQWRTNPPVAGDFFPTGDDERYGSRITELYGTNPIYPAFATCYSAVNDSKTDWYLPTMYEMAIIARNISPINNGLDKASGTSIPFAEYHWTSSEVRYTSGTGTLYINSVMFSRSPRVYTSNATTFSYNQIENGLIGYTAKNEHYYVRCVRRN